MIFIHEREQNCFVGFFFNAHQTDGFKTAFLFFFVTGLNFKDITAKKKPNNPTLEVISVDTKANTVFALLSVSLPLSLCARVKISGN